MSNLKTFDWAECVYHVELEDKKHGPFTMEGAEQFIEAMKIYKGADIEWYLYISKEEK
jgi:hypothetical protein